MVVIVIMVIAIIAYQAITGALSEREKNKKRREPTYKEIEDFSSRPTVPTVRRQQGIRLNNG